MCFLMVGALGPQVDVDGGGRGRNGVRRSLTYDSADSTSLGRRITATEIDCGLSQSRFTAGEH